MTSSDQFGSTAYPPTSGDLPLSGGYPPGGYVPPTGYVAPADDTYEVPASGGEPSTTDVAKDQAASVAGGAADAAKNVAGVAKEQAGQVTAEAGRQAKQLVGQAGSELSSQASTQQQRAAVGLRSVAEQLKSMADGSQQSGVATDLASQASEKVHQVAGWLENREPADILDEVRSFARQRPGVFLLAALGAGIVAGRLARGMTADPAKTSQAEQLPAAQQAYTGTAYTETPYTQTSYTGTSYTGTGLADSTVVPGGPGDYR